MVETRYDEVVTPYESEFLPETPDGRVTNVLLQDKCPADPTDHIGIIYDPVALQWTLNALGRPGPADPGFEPDCTGAGLATFPDSSSVPEGGGGGGSGGGGGGGGAGGGGTGSGPGERTRLVIGHVFRHARATGRRRLRVAVSSRGGRVRGVRVTLRTRAGKLRGRSRKLRVVSRRRAVVIRLRAPLRPGRYVVRARGRDSSGRTLTARRRFSLR